MTNTLKSPKEPSRTQEWVEDLMAALLPLGFKNICDFEALSRVEQSEDLLPRFGDAVRALEARQAVGFLLGLFARRNRTVLFAAANALSSIRSRTATRPLLGILRSSEVMEQRLAAIYALGNLRDNRAATTLMRLAIDKTEPPAIRDFAVEALAGTARKRSRIIKTLALALQDESASVRWTAAWALGCSGAPRAIPFLRNLLGDEEAPPGNATKVSEAAREALEVIMAAQPQRRVRWVGKPGDRKTGRKTGENRGTSMIRACQGKTHVSPHSKERPEAPK